ncbi:hypothetical protein [Spirilliplanes yamanashiensis]|uniref:Uncharacterized protein n=1 Tax=Spirilliplanes yamanashiensis TaxID=42233 RepID=A0A8J3Y6M4_9ACTN|nr:hypothetical protein [Spirilliplanes yamanashiensis]MDP9814658.1 hypothetical protein [Spirilliplanes yamanashiensis]GIJ02312.1 hypothetical protein Sya03_16640 [Spirilliplanes yamanashiensis]
MTDESVTTPPPADAAPPPAAPPAAPPVSAVAEAAMRGAANAAAAAATAAAEARTADLVAGPGGVMTDEVGVVTGDLTLKTELAGDTVTLRVQYKDADEWYVVTGGTTKLQHPADLDAVHAVALALLNRPEG